MDFANRIKELSLKIPKIKDHIPHEASTRVSLVDPFIKALGYDISDPLEVVPEFGANVDVPNNVKNKKVDYAILHEGEPIILIEVKWHGNSLDSGYTQLFNYFTPTAARIGVLTNGIEYRFYSDLEQPNVMDKKPFLVLDMVSPQERQLEELAKLQKSQWDIDDALKAASGLKITRSIKQLLRKQFVEPDEEFVRFFFNDLYESKNFVGQLKDELKSLIPSALKAFIREEIDALLDDVTGSAKPISEPPETEPPAESKIVTTEEELQGFYIIRAILSQSVDLDRVVHRDTICHFGILLDDNNRKPICRLYFNNPNRKKMELFDNGKDSTEKVSIDSLNDIYKYSDRIKAAVDVYEGN